MRAGRFFRALGATLATTIVFVVALVAGIVLHLDLPAARGFVIERADAALASVFEGRIVIDRIGHLGLLGIEGLDAHVVAPDGTKVLGIRRARVRCSVLAIVRSALGSGDLRIELSDVTIEDADVTLTSGPDGALSIARAFQSRPPTSPPAPGPSRGVRFTLARASLAHVAVREEIAGAPPSDVDLDGLGGSVSFVEGKTTILVDKVALRARGLVQGLEPTGELEGSLVLPSAVQGGAFDARATLHARARGVSAVVSAIVDGPVARVEATIEGKEIDLATFSRDLPRSSLGASARATLTKAADDSLSADIHVDALPGTLEDDAIPAAKVDGTFALRAGEPTARGKASIDEPGAPTEVTFELRRDRGVPLLDLDAHAVVARLDRVRRVNAPLRGSADVHAKAQIRIAEKTIDATADADLRDFGQGPDRLARAHAHARARGPLASPQLDVSLTGQELEVAGRKFPTVGATATGTPHALAVAAKLTGAPDTPQLEANAVVALGPPLRVQNARVTAGRGRVKATATAGVVHIDPGGFRAEDVVVEGLGAPAVASVRISPGTIVVRAHGRHVSLHRLARLLQMEDKIRHGFVDFDVDLVLDGRGATGGASADVRNASFAEVEDIDAHLEGSMQGRQGAASLHLALADVGYADARTVDLALGGRGKLALETLKTLSGRVDVDASVDLSKLSRLVGAERLPLKELAGALTVHAGVRRAARADAALEGTVEVKTAGLVLGFPGGARSTGVDGEVELAMSGDTGAISLSGRARDAQGDLATFDASSDAFPYGELITHSERASERLKTVPFVARVRVPTRALDKLPPALALRDVRGEIEVAIDADGTALEPRVLLNVAARKLGAEGLAPSFALSATAAGRYDGKAADLDVSVGSPSAKVLVASAHADAKIADLLGPARPTELPWRASARARLLGFPLGRVAPLAAESVRGTATGEIVLDDLHEDAKVRASVSIADFQLGSTKFGGARVEASAGDGQARGLVRLDCSDGFAEAKADVGLSWGREVVPAPDLTKPLEASLHAKGFDAGALMPFVGSWFSQLEGRIDADARATIDPKTRRPTLEGSLALSDAVVQPAATGTELHDVRFRVVAARDGTVRVEELYARGVTGVLGGRATAHLDGISLVDAEAQLRIPKSQPIPLDAQGVAIGDVDGEVLVHVRRTPDDKRLDAKVDVPSLHVKLPLASSHAVRDLDDAPNVHIGLYDRGGFRALALDGADTKPKTAETSGKELLVAVHLGNDVEIRRGTGLKVSLDGDPVISLASRTTVSGQIHLKQGTLEVQGKKFEIEKGTVTFVGPDPANPLVVVSAGWTAPDGTRVYADFTGPLKTGKVTLRSEPARSKNEILALILFGNADRSASTPYGTKQADATAQAGGAAGGLATEGLSRGIDDLTGLEVSTRIDTSTANPRPEVEVQIARDISIQLAFVLGTPPPGMNPDKTFATIDWRFARRWSLETTFGDQGSSFADVIWQYRY